VLSRQSSLDIPLFEGDRYMACVLWTLGAWVLVVCVWYFVHLRATQKPIASRVRPDAKADSMSTQEVLAPQSHPRAREEHSEINDPVVPRRRLPWLRLLGGAFLCGVIGTFAIFVWPSQYRYDTLQRPGRSLPVRIDRFSGKAEMLETDGWRPMDRPSPSGGMAAQLTSAELAQLTGKAGIKDNGWMSADIYNGNDFDVGAIVVQVTVKGTDGAVLLSRDYRLTTGTAHSLQSSEFIADLGFHIEAGQTFSWTIKSATR
jgi:hypothetical protein